MTSASVTSGGRLACVRNKRIPGIPGPAEQLSRLTRPSLERSLHYAACLRSRKNESQYKPESPGTQIPSRDDSIIQGRNEAVKDEQTNIEDHRMANNH